jgi:HlyD family secretion protein
VETIPNALQVPIQSVVERDGKHYCLLVAANGVLESREVLIGSTNEKFLVIRDGLSQNDQVVMNPRVHMPQLRISEPIATPQDAHLAAQSPKSTGERASRPAPVVGGSGL